MLNRLKIGHRLTLGFGLLILFLITGVGIAFWNMQVMADNLHRISRVYSAEQRMSKEMELQVAIVQRYLRTMLLLDDRQEESKTLADIQRTRQDYDEASRKLEGMLVAPTGKELFAKVCNLRDQSRAANNRMLELREAGKKKDAIAHLLGPARGVNRDWAKALSDLSHFAEAQANRATDEANQAFRKARALMGLLSATALVVGALGAILIRRSIVKPINDFSSVLSVAAGGDLRIRSNDSGRDELGDLGRALNRMLDQLGAALRAVADSSRTVASGAMELSAASEQMSATTQQLAKGSESIHSASERVASAITELSASVQQVAGNAKVTVEQSDLAVKATEQSRQGGRETAKGMERILETTNNISRALMVIQEIARQTNLLSLNAAIEAAKAGHQGKGFAVVAEEVRKLSERSRQAAVEIKELVSQTLEAVENGRASVHSTIGLMGGVHDNIEGMVSLTREIGVATEEQSRATHEVAQHVEATTLEVRQAAAGTHQLSATVQEVARTAADLARISEDLAKNVSRFQL